MTSASTLVPGVVPHFGVAGIRRVGVDQTPAGAKPIATAAADASRSLFDTQMATLPREDRPWSTLAGGRLLATSRITLAGRRSEAIQVAVGSGISRRVGE